MALRQELTLSPEVGPFVKAGPSIGVIIKWTICLLSPSCVEYVYKALPSLNELQSLGIQEKDE